MLCSWHTLIILINLQRVSMNFSLHSASTELKDHLEFKCSMLEDRYRALGGRHLNADFFFANTLVF